LDTAVFVYEDKQNGRKIRFCQFLSIIYMKRRQDASVVKGSVFLCIETTDF